MLIDCSVLVAQYVCVMYVDCWIVVFAVLLLYVLPFPKCLSDLKPVGWVSKTNSSSSIAISSIAISSIAISSIAISSMIDKQPDAIPCRNKKNNTGVQGQGMKKT